MKKIIFIILLSIIIYCIISKKSIIENYSNNFKSIVITPTYPVFNNARIISFEKDSLYYNFAEVLKLFYPLKNKVGKGSVDNIKKLINGDAEFAIAQEDVVLDAVQGKGDFKKKYSNLNIVSSLFEEKICLIFDPNKKIKSWKDLKNKTVCFGKKGSGSLYLAEKLLELINISLDDMNVIYESPYSDKIYNQILENKIDAISVTTSHPNRKLINLFNNKILNIVGIDGIPSIRVKTRFPFWNKSDIDLTRYNLPSLDTKINTFAVKTILVTLSNVEYNTVYRLVNALFANNLFIKNNIKYIEDRYVLEDFPISRSFPKHNYIKSHKALLNYYKFIGMSTTNKNPKCVLFAGTGECKPDRINYYVGY